MTDAKPSAIVRGAAVTPLYPAARILRPEVAEAANLLEDARRELDRARRAAEDIHQAAQLEAQAILAAARDRIAHVAAEARASALADAARQSQTFFSEFEQQTQRLADDLSVHLQRSAWTIASAILKAELSARPERIVELVAATILDAKVYRKLIIRVHPEDAPLVEPCESRLRSLASLAKVFRIKPDSKVPRGGVRIDTEMGTFDGGLAARLANLGHSTSQEPPIPGSDA